MKERPIIMQAESVKAILARCKTQTRRVTDFALYNPSNALDENPIACTLTQKYHRYFGRFGALITVQANVDDTAVLFTPCPYGRPGDRLWVREAWNAWMWDVDECEPYLWTDLSRDERTRAQQGKLAYAATDAPLDAAVMRKWASPLFMPRWASRLTLHITEIRVQRLQDISPADAMAEGTFHMPPNWPVMTEETRDKQRVYCFRCAWDRINVGRGFGWDVNPWVWTISFEVVR